MRIDEMPAGREMDELIKKHVFGEEVECGCFADDSYNGSCVGSENAVDCLIAEQKIKRGREIPGDCKYWKPMEPPPYSTDLAAAWEIVDKITVQKHWKFKLRRLLGKDWMACFTKITKAEAIDYESAPSKTAPGAITCAALKAMGVTEI